MSITVNFRIKSQTVEGKKSFRDVKNHLHILTLSILLVVAALLGGCKKSSTDPPVTNSEKLRFVWLADSRGEALPTPINTEVLNVIISQISTLSPKPSFVIFGGDGAYRGYVKPSYTFQAFKIGRAHV